MEAIIMPVLGLGMESGTITGWLKKEGDSLEKGEALFEVETDKLTSEVESSASGILLKIVHGPGDDVPVNEVIGYVGEQGEAVPETGEPEHSALSPLARDVASSNNLDLSGVEGSGIGGRIVTKDLDGVDPSGEKRVFISPYARKIAGELGIDLSKPGISGSAPGGRIISDDVLARAEHVGQGSGDARTAAGAPGELERQPLSGMRKVIADRMTLSKTSIPHFGLRSVASADALILFRERIKRTARDLLGVRITYTDILIKICALALRNHPELNASLVQDECVLYKDINIGFAVALKNGIVVPTIRSADTLGLADIARRKDELSAKAKAGSIALDEIGGGTFTLTNLGMYRVRSASPVINPPQAAILAVGEIYREPAVIDEQVGIGSFLEFSLACDHRLVDGVKGAEFLSTIVEFVEQPAILAL